MNKKEVRKKREEMIQHLNNARNHLCMTKGIALDIGQPERGEDIRYTHRVF